MRKVVMLSAAAILGIASIAVSQAEEVTESPEAVSEVAEETVAEAPETLGDEPQAAADTTDADAGETAADAAEQADTDADTDTDDDTEAATDTGVEADADAQETAQAAPAPTAEEEIPEDTPQVQKLIALYPNLIARIQPVANICLEGDVCNVTVRAAGASADGGPRDGATVYNAVCQTCHGAGLLGSPILGDAGAWGPRLDKGTETLYTHAIQGFNAMPAKGGADIPDEEVQNAVDYMIEESS